MYLHYSDRVTSHALTLELNANDFGRNENEKEHLKIMFTYLRQLFLFLLPFLSIPSHLLIISCYCTYIQLLLILLLANLIMSRLSVGNHAFALILRCQMLVK